MKLGELIAVARECKGWTLRELEKRTGISNALLSQIETGHIKEPSWRNVVKIAKALNLKLERLASCEVPNDAVGSVANSSGIRNPKSIGE
jgi:transcriptional regulator with XRE-family HTH domain